MAKGWICLHRKITESWLWNDKPFAKGQAWTDLLLMANHRGNQALINNQLVPVQRGELITSTVKLSKRWGWTRKKVRVFLEMLESEKMITRQSSTKYTSISIENYGMYQDKGSDPTETVGAVEPEGNQGPTKNRRWIGDGSKMDRRWTEKGPAETVDITDLGGNQGPAKGQLRANKGPAEGQQRATNNNVNNDNNITTTIEKFMDGIGKHYTALTGRWPSPKDEVAITELAGMTQDIDRVKNIMSDIAKKYEPTRPGEKIRSFRYFLPGIKDQLFIDQKRQGVKSSGNGSSGPDDDQYSGIGISL